MVFYFFRKLIFSPRAGSLVRRIAWLSLVSITLSVSAFLIVIFVMNGMNDSIQRRILALEPHLTVSQKNSVQNLHLEDWPFYKDLKSKDGIRSAAFEKQDVIIRTMDGKFRGAIARGMSLESFEDFIQQLNFLDQGNKNRAIDVLIWDPSEVPAAGEIVMGFDLARSLEVLEGDYLTIVPPEGLILPPGEAPPFEKVRVRKIISTSLADLDAQFVFYQRNLSLKNFSRTASRQMGFEFWLKDGKDSGPTKEDVLETLTESQLKEVNIETWQERNAALFYALKLEKLMIGIFLGLSGLVSSTSILTVLALLMSQKKRDIALLMTLGLSKKGTMKLFTKMGLWLAGIGVVLGLLIGTSLGSYVENHPINVLPQIYYDSQIPARVDWGLVFIVTLISFGIAFLGSWLPARTALEVEPSQALRQKN